MKMEVVLIFAVILLINSLLCNAACSADKYYEPVEVEVEAQVQPQGYGWLLPLFNGDMETLLSQKAKETQEFMINIRRELHQVPELLYELHETTKIVKRVLSQLQIEFHSEIGVPPLNTGIVAKLGSGNEPIIALRTDMDGLPIMEEVKSSYASRHPGKMHACGHDAHMAMLLGAAKILKELEHLLVGTVMLIFQPAEEGGAGALSMMMNGLLTTERFGKPPSRVFGMHVWPTLPSGVVASRPGVLMAAAGFFEIVIQGKGGHAAMPHDTVDPVAVAALAVVNIQTIISRELSPVKSGVISVTKIHAGEAFNVIPGNATIGGTIRSFSPEGYEMLQKRLVEIVTGVAHAHNANVYVKHMSVLEKDFCLLTMTCAFPPLVNDRDVYEFAMLQAESLVGKDRVIRDVEPSMTGEDFAYYAQHTPSAFVWLGSGSNNSTGLHTPTFKLDENVLAVGALLHVSMAFNSVNTLSDIHRLSAGGGYIDEK